MHPAVKKCVIDAELCKLWYEALVTWEKSFASRCFENLDIVIEEERREKYLMEEREKEWENRLRFGWPGYNSSADDDEEAQASLFCQEYHPDRNLCLLGSICRRYRLEAREICIQSNKLPSATCKFARSILP